MYVSSKTSKNLGVVHRPVALASPGILLEIQNLSPAPRSPGSESAFQ